MANDPGDFNLSNLFNPMLLWTDLGLRMADMTLSSTQNIGEGVDRLSRAAADTSEVPDATATVREGLALATPLSVDLPAWLNRSAFELMTHGWLQWMSTLGAIASLAAGLGLRPASARHEGAAHAKRVQGADADRSATQAHLGSASRRHGAEREEVRTESGSMEHALASEKPKRRRSPARAKGKARGSRGA